MFGIKIHRPSPALALAMLALLISLSGTAYAATTLARNSVGTAQLKNGAVTLRKIASTAQKALKPRAWAEVKSDGTILASNGFSTLLDHTASSGFYYLTLTKSATRCAVITSDNPNEGSYTPGGIVQAHLDAGTKHIEVRTQYYDAGSIYIADLNFSIVVYC